MHTMRIKRINNVFKDTKMMVTVALLDMPLQSCWWANNNFEIWSLEGTCCCSSTGPGAWGRGKNGEKLWKHKYNSRILKPWTIRDHIVKYDHLLFVSHCHTHRVKALPTHGPLCICLLCGMTFQTLPHVEQYMNIWEQRVRFNHEKLQPMLQWQSPWLTLKDKHLLFLFFFKKNKIK